MTAEGTKVWPHMRTMRLYSRMIIVTKPVQRAAFSDLSPLMGSSAASSAIGPPVLDQPHEYFLQPIDLVAHRQYFKAGRRELGK